MTRRVVIHIDDVGMCHGANVAFSELSAKGAVSSGSVMVPCPWFPELAEWSAAHPEADMGVHLTLNAEKRHYRWGPVSGAGRSSGLIDPDGYLWRDVASVRRHAHPDAVETEWRAQLDRALAAGIDVTHVDAHMGSALAPEWCDRYVRLAAEYGIPALVTRSIAAYGPNQHLAGVREDTFATFVQLAASLGVPLFDRVLETDFGRPAHVVVGDSYEWMLTEDHGPLVFCAFHANAPGEVEVIEPGTSHVRTDEYALFGTAGWVQWLARQPFEVIPMRTLRDEMRAKG